MISLPQYLLKHESGLRNFSLHFDYFSDWDEAKFKAKIEHHYTAAAPILRHADAALKLLHRRQSAVLKSIHDRGGLCLEITARLASPYLSGLGSCHPTETGFILDRNTGLPYIPASSLKGVLRLAHALNLAELFPEKILPCKEGFEIPDTEETMRKFFGDTDTKKSNAVRGQLVFIDAFPVGIPTMKRDIMNPHFSGYYKGDNPPVETENPIPVMFLAVQDSIDFKFRVFAQPLSTSDYADNRFGDDDKKAIVAMFRRAGKELGFGAKTAVGYGRMENVTDTTELLSVEWHRMAEEENARRFPWQKELQKLEGVSNWGDFRQKGIDNALLKEHSDKLEVSQRIFDLACALRKQAKTNWDPARDVLLRECLAPAGIAWPPVEALDAASSGQNDAAAELERLKSIPKWSDYVDAPADFSKLGKSGLKLMREKLKGWGCEDKNAKEDKKAEFERLKQFLKTNG
jgi:CRISPR-associated protein Cmr6